ncbi:hypothetical protein MCERH10_02824 [Caulobacteraceae bacterium]
MQAVRTIASAARLRSAALAHETYLSFDGGGSITLRGVQVVDEESARAAQQSDIADMDEGGGLLVSYGLIEANALPADVHGMIGLSSMLYAAHLAARCAKSLNGFAGDDGTALKPDAISLFAIMFQERDAARQLTDWALAPPAFWADEGNVSGSPSNTFGGAAQSPTEPATAPEQPSGNA